MEVEGIWRLGALYPLCLPWTSIAEFSSQEDFKYIVLALTTPEYVPRNSYTQVN